eukprot:1187687-Prorocentrum_minimum.AAC.1
MSYFRLQSQRPTVTLLSHVLAQGRAECYTTVTLLSHSHDVLLPAAIPTPHGYTTVTRFGTGAGGVSHYCHNTVTILSHSHDGILPAAITTPHGYTTVTRIGAGEGGVPHYCHTHMMSYFRLQSQPPT